jgi:competence protein ComEC
MLCGGDGMYVRGEHPYLRIKSFDLNTRKNGPTGLPELCPADGFLIQHERNGNKTNILLDAGKKGQGTQVILPYLKKNGINTIDYLILSHAHNDHFGGMIDILLDQEITIDQLIYYPIADETVKQSDDEENYRFWLEWITLIQQKTRSIRKIDESEVGTKLHINPELNFDIVCTPDSGILKQTNVVNLNDFNLVLRLNFHRFSALFPGDCGVAQANQILNSAQKKLIDSVTVLKAAHHGGDESATVAFNRQCDPRLVLITCNEIVVEHRPSFIQNLHDFSLAGAKLIRMDHFHDVDIVTDGHFMTCHAESNRYKETSEFVL